MRLRTAALIVLLAGCTRPSNENEPVVLTYYHLQFCTFCQGVKATVETMPAMYPGRLTVRTVEHLEPEGREAVKKYNFKSHGLVITRGDEVLFRQPDHRVEVEQVRLALDRLLGSKPEAQARSD